MRSFIISAPDQVGYYQGDQIKEDGTGGTCSTNGKDENARKILVGDPETHYLGHTDVDGWIILNQVNYLTWLSSRCCAVQSGRY
jgi:hypothetical protein